MILESLQEFYTFFKPQAPIISIDYGKKKIGLAISTLDHTLPMPLKLLAGDSDKKKLQEISEILKEKNICAIVIGLPLNMDNSKSQQTLDVENFAKKLEKRTHLPIFMQDERLTSKAADNLLKDFGLNRKARNANDDLAAASMILETTIESCNKF